jgi:hypothetical protein
MLFVNELTRRHRVGNVTNLTNLFIDELTKLQAASELESDLGTAPKLEISHYVLLVVIRLAESDEEVLDWLRTKRDEVEGSYNRFVELTRIVMEWERKLQEASPTSRLSATRPDAFGSYTYLSWIVNLSPQERDQRSSVPRRFADLLEQAGIKPLDSQFWEEVDEHFPRYWDYILLTGAINLLTGEASEVEPTGVAEEQAEPEVKE